MLSIFDSKLIIIIVKTIIFHVTLNTSKALKKLSEKHVCDYDKRSSKLICSNAERASVRESKRASERICLSKVFLFLMT